MDYEAKIIRVIDGDTLKAQIHLGFGLYLEKSIRLYGVNTKEIYGEEKEEGLKAKEFVKELIENAKIIISTVPTNDKYGRVLAKIYVNGADLSAILLKNGLAEEFMTLSEMVFEIF